MGDSKDTSDLVENASFFRHVFNFSEDGKAEFLNIMQYSAMSIIPVMILNKAIQRFVPEADDSKGSAELSAEILFQVLLMFVGLVLINRVITYVPTYSGVKYASIDLLNVVLAFMMILLSLQTKVGEKANILAARLSDLWEGTSSSAKQDAAKNSGAVHPGHQPSQADGLSASALGLMPNSPPGLPSSVANQPPQQMQQMQHQATTPFPGGGQMEAQEPMAANAAIGDAFSTLF